ncbi:TolC family protein [Desulfovibrio aminophilus]|nr:TolC family protein [Desulfovibrio aminophilus]MCM0756330.1 TolC family protein [Desulfovibrio aminophilus]
MTLKSKRIFVALPLLFLLLAAPAWSQEAADTMAEPVKPAPVPAGTKLDMRAAVQRGLDANPSIVAARHALLGSESGRKSALADFFPTASSNYGWTHEDRVPRQAGVRVGDQDSWAYQFNLNQPLFTGFRLLSTYQKARLGKEQNEDKLYQAELSLIQSIQTAFLSLLQARMDVKSAQDSVERLKSQLQVTQAFFEVGLKPRLDVLQAEVQLATAQQELLKAQNAVDTQTAQLNTLLDLPLEAGVDYVGELNYAPFSRSLEQCLEQAYKGRPDLRIGEKSVQMAEKDSTITASAYYPQVSANYNYNRAGDDPLADDSKHLSDSSRENWNAGLNVQWKMWQWGSTYYAHDQSQETVKQIRAELDKTRLNAGFEVKSGLLSMQEAADRIGVARKSVEAARESYRMALARYQAQVGTNTDLLTAQSDVTKSEAELNGALADYAKALSNLYVSMGQKNLGLAIE